MHGKHSELALFAVLGVLALFVEGQIYERLIVPQLPSIPKVPLSWWAAEFAAPLFVYLYAGWRGRSLSRTLALASVAYFPWLMIYVAYAVITNSPVGHDMWVEDRGFWIGTALEFVFWVLIACVGLAGYRMLGAFAAEQGIEPDVE